MITNWFNDDPLFNRYYPYDAGYRYYFEHEWGIPVQRDEQLFEFLSLGGFAAGLNWAVVFNKRSAFSAAFDAWQIEVVAAYRPEQITGLLSNSAIIRNRRKIEAVIHNARLIQQIRTTQSFKDYLWQQLGHQQLIIQPQYYDELPRTTITGDRIAQHLQQVGFKFVGPVTINAWLVNTGFITARPDQLGIITTTPRPSSTMLPHAHRTNSGILNLNPRLVALL